MKPITRFLLVALMVAGTGILGCQTSRSNSAPTAAPSAPPAELNRREWIHGVPLKSVPPSWDEAKLMDALSVHLQALANQYLPGHTFTYSGEGYNGWGSRSIQIQWKTETHDVLQPTKTTKVPPGGEGPYVSRPVTRPAPDGLILTVYLQKELGQLARPQTIGNTYYGSVSLTPQTGLLYDVSWGPKTDPKIREMFSSPQAWIDAINAGVGDSHAEPAK